MALNPYSRRPAARVVHVRTFRDGADTLTLAFFRPGPIENCAALDYGNELIAQFLGSKSKPGPGWPAIGGVSVKVSPTVIQNATALQFMQPDNAADYKDEKTGEPAQFVSAEEFVAFQAVLLPDTWDAILNFRLEVASDTGEIPPTSGAGTGASSEPVSGN